MAKQDNFDFDTESKAKFSLDFSFLKNLTQKQKEMILMIAIAVVAVIVIVVIGVLVLSGSSNNDNNAGNIDNVGGSEDSGSDENDTTDTSDPTDYINMNISAKPTKTVYYVGESADYSGLAVFVTGKDDSSILVTYDDNPGYFTITGFNSSFPVEEQVITVTCGIVSDTFTVKIVKVPEDPRLLSIELIPPTKLEYTTNDPFTLEGGYIVCNYDNGDVIKTPLLLDYLSGFEQIYTGPGVYEIKVTYRQGPVTLETSYTVTVTE